MLRIGQLDAAALALMTHDATLVADGDLTEPTPCDGWTVADLLRHLNDEHEAIAETVLGPVAERADDPRDESAVIAARWILALDKAGHDIVVPKLDARIPVARVSSVHFVDMLVHRWDLARAVGRPVSLDPVLAESALPLAREMTAPGSPLLGRAYGSPWSERADRDPIDNLAALLGRDPDWTGAR